MYEHVDCIFSSCGSLHLCGPCSSSLEPGSSAVAPLFGPWMAALRHRKPSPVLLKAGDLSGKALPEESMSKAKDVSLGDQEGWRKPGKVSRRRTVPSSSIPNVAIIHSVNLEEKGPCRDTQPVLINVHSETEFSSAPVADSGDSLIAATLPSSEKVSKGRRRNNPPVIQGDKKLTSDSIFQFKAKFSAVQAEIPTVSHDADPSS